MTPDRWQQVAEAFEAALDLSTEQRGAFLAKLSSENSSIGSEVEAMLAEDALQGASPEPIDAPCASVSPGAALVGKSLGGYQITRVVGEGGMGIVFEAEQDHPRRSVALKVIQPGFASSEVLRRFERESQVLALLQHPGIAQIFEAGAADTGYGPQPYFAMEFIHGAPLGEYAEREKLGARQRLALLASVCDAVEHAHQRGIIHRDLKPANILVDASGQPKILDFGVARMIDRGPQSTRHTSAGQLIGTLNYMSPEQVTADPESVDARSDVYALGVLLYELLANRLPYPLSGQFAEAFQTIREQEPVQLSTIQRAYRGDVETIVAKALEKDKARRYASAGALAADIRRYLADEPIAARPASAIYRLRKFTRRHTALVSAAVTVLAVLVGGIIVSTREAVKARRAQQAEQAVNDFLQNDLLAQASPNTQASPATKPDPDLKVRTALDRAAARIGTKFSGQPEVEASIRSTIGQTYQDLGLYPQARAQFERALELQRRVLGERSPVTLRTLYNVGWTANLQAKFPEAETLLNQSLEMQRRVLGAEHPETLTSAQGLAMVYVQQGKFEKAEALMSRNLEIRRRTVGPEDRRTVDTIAGLASVYTELGKYPQAEALQSQALEIRRRILGPEHPSTLASMHNLADMYSREGKYPEAEALFLQVLDLERRILGAEHRNTLVCMSNLGWVYRSQGKYGQAERLDRQTLELRQRVLGPEHRETLNSMDILANAYAAEGKYAQAEALLRTALEIRHRVLGPQHPDTLRCVNLLAFVYGLEGRNSQADALFQPTAETTRRVLGPEHPLTLEVLSTFAFHCQREGNYQAAESYAAQMLEGNRHAQGPTHPETIASAADLALAYLSQKKFTEAEPLARQALDFYQKDRPDDWQRFRAETLLAAAWAGEKRFGEAEPLLLEGYQGMTDRKDRIAVPDRYHLERAREWLTQLYLGWGKPGKAVEWRTKAAGRSGQPFIAPAAAR